MVEKDSSFLPFLSTFIQFCRNFISLFPVFKVNKGLQKNGLTKLSLSGSVSKLLYMLQCYLTFYETIYIKYKMEDEPSII